MKQLIYICLDVTIIAFIVMAIINTSFPNTQHFNLQLSLSHYGYLNFTHSTILENISFPQLVVYTSFISTPIIFW